MRAADRLTLNQVKNSPKMTVKNYRPSDFLTSQEQADLRKSNEKGKKNRKKFDEIDAYAAEILARFGYDAYMAWNAGVIPSENMNRYLLAERSRDTSGMIALYGLIMSLGSSMIKKERGKPAPKGPKIARKILQEEIKKAKGEI